MVNSANNPFRRFLSALVVGGLIGAVLGLAIRSQMRPSSDETPPAPTMPPSLEARAAEPAASGVLEDNVAWHYAQACRDGNWDRVAELTLWIQERLDFVRESGGAEAADAEKERLIDALGTRVIADNRLQKEGVDDIYVFSPSAEIVFDSVDSGREDLEAPVVRRTWFRVQYPAREKSLLDSDNVPIRALRVGVNVSREGRVLKANVLGNLDIDWESISYDWPSK